MNTINEPETVAERLRFCLPRLTAEWRDDLRIADLHLDSMDTVELLCVVHEEFGVRIMEADFHPAQTIGGLLAVIARKEHSEIRTP